MARIAKFRYGTTDVDITFDGSPWNMVSWVPKASVAGEDVEETPTVLIVTDDDDLLATEIQLLDDLILRVSRYRENPAYEEPVWLHAKRNEETGERRAIVKHLSYTPLNSEFDCKAMQHQAEYQVTIVRGGWWEDTVGQRYGGLAQIAGASLEWDYTGAVTVPAHDVVGDVPARIDGALFVNITTPTDKLYAGIRSANVRQVTNWEGIWECEDGTNTARGADDAGTEINTSSPGAAAGIFVVGTPSASNTWEEYLGIQLSNVYAASANYDAAFGTFLWLLRCKVGAAANTYQVQLRWGYHGMADADYVRGPIVEVTNIAWDYAEMGVQKIPLRDMQAMSLALLAVTFEGVLNVQIWAKRTLGASTLKLDCLCPIAVDEGYAIVKEGATATSDVLVFCEGPAGVTRGYSYTDAGDLAKFSALNSSGFAFPPGDGRVDLVYTRDGSSVLTDTLTVVSQAGATYFERWRSLRGSE